jgi:formylglycine-generating enzyme required for sulfatase activity
MKKLFLIISVLLSVATYGQRSLLIHKDGNIRQSFPVLEIDSITFGTGQYNPVTDTVHIYDTTHVTVYDIVTVININGRTLTMLPIAGSTFTMGCTDEQGEDCWDGEKPSHSVTLSSYTMGETEVTQGLWWAVMGSWPDSAPNSNYGVGDNYPMYYVSWDDIVGTTGDSSYVENGITYKSGGFCYKLSMLLNGRDTTGMEHYRLPTEAEWEYAARGGSVTESQTKYSGSNTIGDVAWYKDNSSDASHPAGQKQANALGIYDMSGNVKELCADSWDGSSRYSSSEQTDPVVLNGSFRIVRGGSWLNDAKDCRVSYRSNTDPSVGYLHIGFRLACSSK